MIERKYKYKLMFQQTRAELELIGLVCFGYEDDSVGVKVSKRGKLRYIEQEQETRASSLESTLLGKCGGTCFDKDLRTAIRSFHS